MLKTLIEAFALISTWEVIIAMFAASVYGLVIGSLPGLSATMATALLVPVTFYLSPIAAIATIVAASSMAIFSGDIPGALLRIPGTPASAAYADEAYAMTRKGQPELALGICVWFSALGGIISFSSHPGRTGSGALDGYGANPGASRRSSGVACCNHSR